MSKVSRATANLRRWTAVLALIIAAFTGSPARAESAATAQPRSSAQLEQLVAPIALYPDSLLAQVLMASTYPFEVVQAARWVRENSNVTGKALEDAMQNQQWDPSVKALTSVPQTLQMMNDKLDWTQQLGDAFLAQQQDVLDAVQRLRGRADAAGHLQTTEQQKVTRTPRSSSGGQATTSGQAAPGGQDGALPPLIYSIESANPEVYYVPIYDPGAVYGAWLYPDYPPYSWYPPGYVASNVFSFAAGAFVGAAVWGNIDWRRRRTDINVANFNRFNRTNITDNTWAHNPAHRHGTPYRDANVAARFADQNRTAARENFRGKAEAGQRDLAKRGAQGDLGKRGGQGELGKGGGQADLGKRGPDSKGKTAGQNTKAKQTAAKKQQGQAKNAQRSQQQARNTQNSQQQARNTQKSKQAHNVKRSQPQARNVQRARQAPATHQRARAQQHARPGGGGGRGGGMGGGRGGGRGRR